MKSALIPINFVAGVINVVYYVATDNCIAPLNLFVGGLSIGTAITLIFCAR